MCAVSRTEGVIHIGIGHGCQLLSKGRVIVNFLSVVADVFQKQQAAVFEVIHSLGDGITHTLFAERYWLADEFGKFAGYWAKAHRRLAHALGTTKMGDEDDLCAFIGHCLEGREGGTNAGVVINHHRTVPLSHGHIVIYTREHAFPLQINVVNGQFSHQIGRGE